MNPNDNAFPVNTAFELHNGMTIRTYLAGQALAGWMSTYAWNAKAQDVLILPGAAENAGMLCVRAADAVIAALQNEKTALAT